MRYILSAVSYSKFGVIPPFRRDRPDGLERTLWECSQTRTVDRGVAYVCSGAYAGIGGGSDVGAEAKFGTFCSDNPLVF